MRIGESISRCPPERSRSIPHARATPPGAYLGGRPEDETVCDLPRLLRPGDLLVVNDTEVLPARLFGRRGTVPIEATLIDEAEPGRWRALVRPAQTAAR